MRLTICAMLLGALAAAPAYAEADADGWETVATTPILIRTRPRPNSAIKEVWAEGLMNAPVQDVQATLMDPDRFPRFMPYVKESRHVGQPNPDGSRLVYTRLELPFPLRSRDYVLRVYLVKGVAEDGSGEFANRWSAVNDPKKFPPRANSVRVTVNDGSWHVTPKGHTASWAVYKFSVDPAGLIPNFLADQGNKEGVLGTFQAVEKEAQRRFAERRKAAAQRDQAHP